MPPNPRIHVAPFWLQWGHRFSSVEMRDMRTEIIGDDVLQWGHRFSSVEMGIYQPFQRFHPQASMGPPIFIGGNGRRLSITAEMIEELQWGHRFSSVEMYSSLRRQCPAPARFNGATDFHRWK